MVESDEKPLCAAKAARSKALSPIAVATRGLLEDGVLIMPKGILAREK